MQKEQPQPHFLLLSFPAQGHINPILQFAKCLVRTGALVTFVTAVSAYRRIMNNNTHTPEGLSFASFSDGYDDGINSKPDDPAYRMSEFKRCGSEAITELIKARKEQGGQPVTCLVCSLLMPWAAQVARTFHLPSAILWLQPALVLDVYYYYFYGYGDVIKEKANNDLIELPGLPPLITGRDLPSFIDPTKSTAYSFILPAFKEQMETIVEETNPRILVNTFDALEPETLKVIDKFNMIAIGPLLPSAFVDGKDQSDDTGYGGDLFKSSTSKESYMEWLSSKPKSSVIYVSFGSICVLEKRQMEEIAHGLQESGHPFLWVIREKEDKDKDKEEEEEDEQFIKYKEELNEKGMIVPWCSQVDVLSHPSVGCFITHCGWNSSLESLVSGVPVVAFPQWTDQGTNAKIIVDVCKIGVRVNGNEEGIVGSDEIKRCLELVMGQGDEFRINALKWKDLAREAAKQGGSSHNNLKAFADEFST